ncbi:hypothetical protein [Deinococcus sonorensis]|uniref:Cytochrome c oxidase assembly protein n=2 Tax=Deinococcus sonorensis TaxID=309891 RepID=A0AAU7U4A9_9DEIO
MTRLPLGLASAGVLLAGWLYTRLQMPEHMLAHLLLSLVVPPLLLLGRPGWRPRVPAWLGGLALASVTVLTHLPATLTRVDAQPDLLAVEGVAFLGAGTLFALALWPATVASLAVTVLQMAVCALTGAWVAFGSGMDNAGLVAGVLMWVGGGLLYTLAALTIVARMVATEKGAVHVH